MKNPVTYLIFCLKELFMNDETVDYGFGAIGAIFWLLIYSAMSAVAPLSWFVVFTVAVGIFFAVSYSMKLMDRYPNFFIVLMLFVLMVFTYIQAGLRHVA